MGGGGGGGGAFFWGRALFIFWGGLGVVEFFIWGCVFVIVFSIGSIYKEKKIRPTSWKFIFLYYFINTKVVEVKVCCCCYYFINIIILIYLIIIV